MVSFWPGCFGKKYVRSALHYFVAIHQIPRVHHLSSTKGQYVAPTKAFPANGGITVYPCTLIGPPLYMAIFTITFFFSYLQL